MGMPITVEVVDGNVGADAFDKVYDYFEYVDDKFSTYKKDSEITKINDSLVKEAEFSEDMKTVFELSKQTKEATGGYFDIENNGKIDPSGLVKGWAIFNYTPRGKNHGFDLFEMAKNNPKWFVQKLTVDDTKVLTEEEIDEERKSGMTEDMIQQEYYCSFTAAIQGAYYWKQYDEAERAGRFMNVPYDDNVPVYTVWDLGVSDAMAIGFYQIVGKE